MERQHTENLFRRYKGQLVNVKTISTGIYKGRVGEITNDYVALTDRDGEDETQTFNVSSASNSGNPFVIVEAASCLLCAAQKSESGMVFCHIDIKYCRHDIRSKTLPNPWLTHSVEWLGEPPEAKLEVFEETQTRKMINTQ